MEIWAPSVHERLLQLFFSTWGEDPRDDDNVINWSIMFCFFFVKCDFMNPTLVYHVRQHERPSNMLLIISRSLHWSEKSVTFWQTIVEKNTDKYKQYLLLFIVHAVNVQFDTLFFNSDGKRAGVRSLRCFAGANFCCLPYRLRREMEAPQTMQWCFLPDGCLSVARQHPSHSKPAAEARSTETGHKVLFEEDRSCITE